MPRVDRLEVHIGNNGGNTAQLWFSPGLSDAAGLDKLRFATVELTGRAIAIRPTAEKFHKGLRAFTLSRGATRRVISVAWSKLPKLAAGTRAVRLSRGVISIPLLRGEHAKARPLASGAQDMKVHFSVHSKSGWHVGFSAALTRSHGQRIGMRPGARVAVVATGARQVRFSFGGADGPKIIRRTPDTGGYRSDQLITWMSESKLPGVRAGAYKATVKGKTVVVHL